MEKIAAFAGIDRLVLGPGGEGELGQNRQQQGQGQQQGQESFFHVLYLLFFYFFGAAGAGALRRIPLSIRLEKAKKGLPDFKYS